MIYYLGNTLSFTYYYNTRQRSDFYDVASFFCVHKALCACKTLPDKTDNYSALQSLTGIFDPQILAVPHEPRQRLKR